MITCCVFTSRSAERCESLLKSISRTAERIETELRQLNVMATLTIEPILLSDSWNRTIESDCNRSIIARSMVLNLCFQKFLLKYLSISLNQRFTQAFIRYIGVKYDMDQPGF